MAEAASAAVAGSSSSQTTATLLERAAAARVAKERELAALPGKDTEAPSASSHAASYHHWRSNDEVKSIQSALLAWYDAEHRKMPWRVHDTLDSCDKAPSQRAYEVWVSEIMLQQTQVATVIPYYERWMAKWPTVNDLASASAEEVNELWSGLGYYSRATRLHAAAKLLVEKFNGTLPKDPAELKKSVPGIGPYTAGAVTSIAYNVKAELVDGNVARVYGRMRAIGGDPKAKATDTLVWKLAADAVSPDRPGAFNQALMDLGATICTPQNPNCGACPLSNHCLALAEKKAADSQASKSLFATEDQTSMPSSSSPSKEEVIDVEDTSCTLCFAPSSDFSVTRYPPKPVKKKSREEEHLLCIVESAGKFLVVQRPSTGLLASLWQFPMLESGELDMEAMSAVLREHAGDLELPEFKELGTVKHVFSHLVWNLRVFACIVSDEVSERECKEGVRWLDEKGLEEAALPTGMRKAFGLRKPAKGKKRKGNQSDGENEPVKAPTKRGKKEKVEKEGKQQKDIKSFFTKAAAN